MPSKRAQITRLDQSGEPERPPIFKIIFYIDKNYLFVQTLFS
jgi:hypothetical protein